MFPHDRRAELDGSELTDEQTRAQVVEPAKQIVKLAALQGVTGSFRFDSCNDQGEPPFRGVAGVSFVFPSGADPQGYIEQIASTMIAHGWSDGPPPGKRPYGRLVHQGQMLVIISPNPDHPERGLIEFRGECRNLTDQRKIDGEVPVRITDELTG